MRSYSQNDEDEILRAIFDLVGIRDRFFVEVGAADGSENCTRALLDEGWNGVWVEADPLAARRASQLEKAVTIVKGAVTPGNVTKVLFDAGVPQGPDLLVLDIDGNDYWVLRRLLVHMRPRVLLVEYNATFLPGQIWIRPPRSRVWDGTFRHGASLEALSQLVSRRGYKLVACDSKGVNAFYVHDRAMVDGFFAPGSVAAHYTAPWFTGLPFGHLRARRACRPMLALPPSSIRNVVIADVRREGTRGPVEPGAPVAISACVRNGTDVTLTSGQPAPISVGVQWYDQDGGMVEPEPGRVPLPVAIGPGRVRRVTLWAPAPRRPGCYRLAFTLVQEWVAWWTDVHGESGRLCIDVEVRPR